MVGGIGWFRISFTVCSGSSKLMVLGWRPGGVVADSPSAIEEVESSCWASNLDWA